MSPDTQQMLTRVRGLELEIQRVAFEMLQEDGSYDQSQQLLVVASDVRKLGTRLDAILSGKVKRQIEPATKTTRQPTASRSRRTAGAKYPVFYLNDDRLVKIGKGKQKTAKEYRHEATRGSFDMVARWIEETSLSGSREWFARTADEQLSDQVPTYQVYLVISALQEVGVVRSVRRGWYALADDVGSPEDWWRRLEAMRVQDTVGGDD